MMTPVLVSGIGLLSPFGNTVSALMAGLMGDGPVFQPVSYPHLPEGSAGFVSAGHVHRPDFPKMKRLPNVSQFAFAACVDALVDAGLDVGPDNCHRIGLFFGTTNGASHATQMIYDTLYLKGPRLVEPSLFQETVFNASVAHISIALGIKGPSLAFPGCICSGGYAIETAMMYLQAGLIDYALVGGADEYSALVHQSFSHTRLLARDPGRRSVPLDRHCHGMRVSEGAAFVVLEKPSTFHDRLADRLPYAILESVQTGQDGTTTLDARLNRQGLALQLDHHLGQGPNGPLDAVVVSASGHPALDGVEAEAVGDVCPGVPMTSIKGTLGETQGASVVFNMVAAIEAFATHQLAPVFGLNTPCHDQNPVIVDRPLAMVFQRILIHFCFFGGISGSLILKRFPTEGSP